MNNGLEILLVEDNEGDVMLTQRAFHEVKPACRISVANDGIEAIDFLNKRGNFTGVPTPQLILLDLNMPRMDGKKFLEVMKLDDQFKTIPVVMFTSSESKADIRDCYQRQASCYVVKPFDCKKFMEAIKQVTDFWCNLGKLP
jgi:chemotaxis family two-component system response regulator Rcp1